MWVNEQVCPLKCPLSVHTRVRKDVLILVVMTNEGFRVCQTPRTYCAANTEDLEIVIEHVQRSYAAAPIMAAGVSMGGYLQLSAPSPTFLPRLCIEPDFISKLTLSLKAGQVKIGT